MSLRWPGILAFVVGSVACVSSPVDIATSDAPRAPDTIGLSELTRLDLLPRFKRSVRIGSFSSYDRTGGNDDGFSGAYSFVRKDEEGLVLAELDGPVPSTASGPRRPRIMFSRSTSTGKRSLGSRFLLDGFLPASGALRLASCRLPSRRILLLLADSLRKVHQDRGASGIASVLPDELRHLSGGCRRYDVRRL